MSIPTKWEGHGEESWWVEVEHDCFKEGEPYVVSVWTEHTDLEDGDHKTLAMPTPDQAREMAAALVLSADMADKANARVSGEGGEEG